MQRKRKGRRSRGRDDDGTNKRQNGGNDGGENNKLRIRVVTYLNGNPGNRRTSTGEPIFMISIADRDGSIETIAMNVRDTKKLIIDGLIALHEAHQPFATYLINQYFKVDCPNPHDDWSTED
jgi:hypothetical protein